MNNTAVLLCKCKATCFDEDKNNKLYSFLENCKIDLFELDDICAYSLTNSEDFNSLDKRYAQKIVLACHARAVKSLYLQNGVSWADFHVINSRDNDIEASLHQLGQFKIEKGGAVTKKLISNLEVPSWYPVIDTARCSSCGRCARFCLFGVYRFENGILQVQQPLNCKDKCPACARTCPESAIIFPKIAEGGIIAGAEPGKQNTGFSVVQGNLSSRLAERKMLRASILKPEIMQKAEQERFDALKKFGNLNTKKND